MNADIVDRSACSIWRRLWGIIARRFSPGYSWCFHCGRPWNVCEGHKTFYAPGQACFPLCEACWSELTSEQRLFYYQQLWAEWQNQGSAKPQEVWNGIEQAVLSGK